MAAGATSALLAGPATAAELTVTVTGLRSDEGDVHVAVYDDPAGFPDSDGMLEETQVPARNGRATASFGNLAAGTYAVAVYHDENGNDDFDQGFLGIPLEGYGFTNDVRPFFSAPAFERAAFDLPAAGGTVRIRIGY